MEIILCEFTRVKFYLNRIFFSWRYRVQHQYLVRSVYKKSNSIGVVGVEDIQNRIETWDMSYKSIKDIIQALKKEM